MQSIIKLIAALAVSLAALGFTAASADHRDGRGQYRSDNRPDYCATDHDHRSHNADYYNYYPADRYSRAGAYRAPGLSISLRLGSDNDYSYGRRYDDRRAHRGNRGHRGRHGSRVVKRQSYDTRFRAQIILVEEVHYSRRGERLVCTLDVRGPDARYVPRARLRNIAARECSRRADVRFV